LPGTRHFELGRVKLLRFVVGMTGDNTYHRARDGVKISINPDREQVQFGKGVIGERERGLLLLGTGSINQYNRINKYGSLKSA
jgi:hypothetical protein